MGARDVIVTIRLPGVEFIGVVHSDHASILHRYGDMAPQILDARTCTRKKRRKKGKRKRKGREMKKKKMEQKKRKRKKKRNER